MMCNCVDTVNEGLHKKNTRLALSYTLSLMGGFVAPLIKTERLNNFRDGGKPANVIPAYCPFCGVKYEKETSTKETVQDQIPVEKADGQSSGQSPAVD